MCQTVNNKISFNKISKDILILFKDTDSHNVF